MNNMVFFLLFSDLLDIFLSNFFID